MKRAFLALLPFLFLEPVSAQVPVEEQVSVDGSEAAPQTRASVNIYVVDVQGQIAKPTLFVIRRALKEAISSEADYFVLNMHTPGGDLGSTLGIMESLDRFETGRVVTFVNKEAGSAGAIIAATTDDIYFAPKAVMGAAEPILATGGDAPEGLRRKITSYLSAKVRAFADGDKIRGGALQAMMDPTYEFKIGEIVIKEKDGPLLTVTADEAMAQYGDPPRPMLGAGIAEGLQQLYESIADGKVFEIREFEMTWSIKLAQWITGLGFLLLGLGGFLIYMEFKTPGFGIFGVSGTLVLLLFFFGHHLAGLSGYEPMLVFLLGVLLVLSELLLFPGVIIPAVVGLLLMFMSLVWGMADIWPNEPIVFSGDLFRKPLINLGLGMLVSIAIALALIRFLPSGWFWQHLAIQQSVAGSAQSSGGAPAAASALRALVGRTGTAATDLFPSGQIEIDGRRYEARTGVQSIPRGTTVVVTGCTDFGLMVERKTT